MAGVRLSIPHLIQSTWDQAINFPVRNMIRVQWGLQTSEFQIGNFPLTASADQCLERHSSNKQESVGPILASDGCMKLHVQSGVTCAIIMYACLSGLLDIIRYSVDIYLPIVMDLMVIFIWLCASFCKLISIGLTNILYYRSRILFHFYIKRN